MMVYSCCTHISDRTRAPPTVNYCQWEMKGRENGFVVITCLVLVSSLSQPEACRQVGLKRIAFIPYWILCCYAYKLSLSIKHRNCIGH